VKDGSGVLLFCPKVKTIKAERTALTRRAANDEEARKGHAQNVKAIDF
jgi:hypothetical protein